MILPLLVFGSSKTTMIWRGFAIAPISLVTWLFRLCSRSLSAATPPRRITKATIAWPVISSFAQTTAASAIDGCETRADSTSVVEIRCPETFITSSTLPRSQSAPSLSSFAPSPAK